MKSALLLLVTVAVCAAASGCKPKPGESCKREAKEICLDEKTAVACHDGKWEEMSCRGPEGCSKSSGDTACDQSVAEPNDVCNLADDFLCTADKKAMLACTKNRWTLAQRCLGDRGCTMEQRKVTCDNSLANAGDACREEEDYACSPDKKAALVCQKGVFVQVSPCKGPKGCGVTGTKEQGFKVECDDSVASAGDPCDKEEQYSCSSDERAILKCTSKRFEVEERCRSKERCQIKGGQVGCY